MGAQILIMRASGKNEAGWGSGSAAVWGKGWGKMKANVGEFVRSVDTDRV